MVENIQEVEPTIRDKDEIMQARWFTIEEMRGRCINVDASFFLRELDAASSDNEYPI